MAAAGPAYIAGAFEHPTRFAPDKSVAQLHAEAAHGALADAGLSLADVDGYFCAGDAPGNGAAVMLEYLNLNVRHVDSTDIGGASYIAHVAHAAQAIAAGRCRVALITLGGRPKADNFATGTAVRDGDASSPARGFEAPYRGVVVAQYAMCAARHMHEFGTTSEQLAWIKVAASQHARHNPHALFRTPVSVEEVLSSPLIATPLHKLDCCVVTDGGGALVVVHPDIARSLGRPLISVRGAGETVKHQMAGKVDLTWSGARRSGADAFAMAGCMPSDIQYASIYDSFTISVLMAIEDLGFCAKGKGGAFVADGGLISGVGRLPFNTDGGGLCSNHPANRGGMTKVIEAVRQLRGEAQPAVQVPNCTLALAHGTGGVLSTRHGSATLILERQ
jgi:acetyl-CoA C-acetyltransferase